MNYVIFTSVMMISFFTMQLVVYIYRLRDRIFYRGFLGIVIALSIYSFFYAIELLTFDIEKMKILASFQRFGSLMIASCWLVMSLEYTQRQKYINYKLYIILLIIPVMLSVMNLTDKYHHLFYKSYNTEIINSLSIAQITPGIGYILSTIYLNLMLFYGNYLFISFMYKKRILCKRSLIIILTSLFPWIGITVYFLGILPIALDINVLILFLISLLFTEILLRNKLFHKIKIARHLVFDNIKEMVIVLDNDERIIDTNNAADKFFNIESYLIDKQKINEIIPNLKNLNESSYDFDMKIGEDHKHFHCEISNVKNTGKIIIIKDITDEMLMIKNLQYYATMDKLTEVYNRNYFNNLAQEKLNYCNNNNRPFTIVIADLDFFKNVNDTFGHIVGDMVLRDVIKIMRDFLGEGGVIFRYGGEEFIIILEDVSQYESYEIIENIRVKIMKYHFNYEDKLINMTCSFGLYTANSENTLEDIIKKADEALYRSKLNGRNKVSIYEE